MRGKFVFQDTPIAPPGTPVLVYESPHNRGSWAPHGVPGFYVGPALAHYRCYTVFIPKTCKTRVTDTLSWHPKSLVVPGTSAVEAVTAAAKDLETALLKLPFNATMRQPFDNMETTVTATLNDMRALFPTNTRAPNVMLINACIPDPDSEFLTADISDFYLGTPLDTPEYMSIRLDQMPEASRRKYIHDLSLVRNGCILVEITRSLYGLPQAGRLSQQRLIRHLEAHGYKQATHTPCLFTHIDRPVSFTLIVDDFGIKYTGRQHADHLIHPTKM